MLAHDHSLGLTAPGEAEHSTSPEVGGLWERRGLPPRTALGVDTAGAAFGRADGVWGYRRLAASYESDVGWMFEGVEDAVIGDFGLNLGTAAGCEIDRVVGWDWDRGHAPLVLARATHDSFVAPERPPVPVAPAAEIALMPHRMGGAVFSVGSITWTGSLSHAGYENNVSRITENVLRHFLATPRGAAILPRWNGL